MRSAIWIRATRKLKAPRLLSFFLCVLCASVVNIAGQEFKTVAPGVEYAEVTRTIDNSPVRMNLLRLDLTKVRLDVVHANDKAIGTETVSSIAKRHGAFAAINGGYFRVDDSLWAGDPAGVLVVNGKLLSESHKVRVAIGLINRGPRTEVYLGHPRFFPVLLYEKRKGIRIDGLNRERKPDEIVAYTPEFGASTNTDPGSEFIVMRGRIVTKEDRGNSSIPPSGFVLSVGGSNKAWKGVLDGVKTWVGLSKADDSQRDILGDLDPDGSRQRKLLMFEPGLFRRLEDVTNGVPQLINNGKIEITWEEEGTTKAFVETRHPRTAVAKLRDGKFLMITVDGRSESSGGISLTDLAAYLLEIGATDAMNLDGGGSTTMFLNGKVVNHPSDKEGERKVSDAILVTLRRKTVPKGDKH